VKAISPVALRSSFSEIEARLMSQAEPSGRVALLAGLSAAFIAVSFGYLHSTVLLDWPDVALDGSRVVFAYFVAGTVFQFGLPILCFAAFIFGVPSRRLWTTRLGLACAGAALVSYALYVRACLDMIG
jgi:hypothetical protein